MTDTAMTDEKLRDLATEAAAFAVHIKPLTDGVTSEHIMAMLSYACRGRVMTAELTAAMGKAYELLAAAAAEYQ